MEWYVLCSFFPWYIEDADFVRQKEEPRKVKTQTVAHSYVIAHSVGRFAPFHFIDPGRK